MSVNHINGIIYLVTNEIDDMKYIGSTSLPMPIRWNEHRSDCMSEHKGNSKFHKHMRKLGRDKFSWIVLEHFSCPTLKHLKYREGVWHMMFKPALNTVYNCISEEDKQARIKASQKKTQKEYNKRPEVRARKNAYNKEYNKRPEVRTRRRELARKRYTTENRRAVYERETVEQKERRLAARRLKLSCLCGGLSTHGHRAMHFKSKRHTAWSIDHGELNTYEKCFTKIE